MKRLLFTLPVPLRLPIWLALAGLFGFCRKSEYLAAKPDESLIIPENLQDFQYIIDNPSWLNGTNTGGLNPTLGEAAADNYYLFNSTIGIAFNNGYKNICIWNDDIYDRQKYDWSYAYRAVFYCNVVLDGLSVLSPPSTKRDLYDEVKGRALFFRSEMFYQLAQVFAPHYNRNSSNTDWGIVLKTTADINEPIKRATVEQTYDKIMQDVKLAIDLLPSVVPTGSFKTRPSKPAALGLLARVYLTMQEYDSAFFYSNACLQLHDVLLDYNDNTWVITATYPIKQYNPEVILHSRLIQTSMLPSSNIRIDTNLYKSYQQDDLRRKYFFRSQPIGVLFGGSYDGSSTSFGGIATDEIYLIRAECYARLGETKKAMDDLNHLLRHRYVTGTFTDLTAASPQEALSIVLTERRKELLFRGLRWTDLRRLNAEGANITLRRVVDGVEYTLPPNDPRYTFLIPPDVISFNPGMPQNPR